MNRLLFSIFAILMPLVGSAQTETIQKFELNAKKAGKRFDGIGLVNGGGGTSVLLKDYPEPQRTEILDLVYKPMFGASVSTLLVEVPGDGNSTQGSMPSHMHSRDDLNYQRGYTWWVMKEAKKRNRELALDGAAWSAPGWVGDGNFWSQDAADYYVSWLQGLRDYHGLKMTAMGCRNEKGDSYEFAKMLRKTLNDNGFEYVQIHAFDNWYKGKLNFVKDLLTDKDLQISVDIIGGHVFNEVEPVSEENQKIAEQLGKPIWNTEDHVYKKGFDCLISLVECFNKNYINSGVTKIVNWYDIGAIYPLEPYAEDPPIVHAYEPWSGHYRVREAIWGYAHYGQFTKIGWQYMPEGCKLLAEGGSMVTMKAPDNNYSIIIETKGAKATQQLEFKLKGLSDETLCVWKSNEEEQFIKQNEVTTDGKKFVFEVEPNTVYSLSTMKGQRKATYSAPPSQPFPFPYFDTFDQYEQPDQWGYLPHYFADIAGAFEITEAPERHGKCLRQMTPLPTISWAPEWKHYTIIGDEEWSDYEVSADVKLNPGDAAAVMGRLNHFGYGWGYIPKGYYFMLDNLCKCKIVVVRGKVDKKKVEGDAEQQALINELQDDSEGGEKVLAESLLMDFNPTEWHKLTIRFENSKITGLIDGKKVIEAEDFLYHHGMAGLLADVDSQKASTPYFDNFKVNEVGKDTIQPTPDIPNRTPIYPLGY